MTQDQPPAYVPQPHAPKRSNPLGLTALIVGIVAIVGCAIPIVNFVSIFLGAVALILGIIGLVQKNRPRGLAIAGSILGVIALLVGILTASFYAAAAGSRTVHYEVTSDGKTLSSVSYLTVNDGKSSTQQDTSATAPWSKDVPIADEGLFTSSVFSLVAQAGADATTISCKITADGKTIQESTSTGPYAVASCSGSAS
ncbi:MmpS family transport accessory protein [Curtobacterium sp. GD1]|uniref:MmpS family transport accessory protein n=1 Tax=Curtobacterium sp. GD1 TaxID=2810612 RepID=UPI001E4EAC96|nr:MmpS family transport accessory protein [Curtobacterium sp. GD1]MCC8908294.1 hypothetical protein [Curtobacterium sp. GD1]